MRSRHHASRPEHFISRACLEGGIAHVLTHPPRRRAGDWQGAVLRSSHQFYKWYSELAVVRREQVQGEYAEYLESLTNRLQLTQEITGRVDGSLAALDGLQGDHTGVVAKVRPRRLASSPFTPRMYVPGANDTHAESACSSSSNTTPPTRQKGLALAHVHTNACVRQCRWRR